MVKISERSVVFGVVSHCKGTLSVTESPVLFDPILIVLIVSVGMQNLTTEQKVIVTLFVDLDFVEPVPRMTVES